MDFCTKSQGRQCRDVVHHQASNSIEEDNMALNSDIEQRIQALEDRQALCELKARYARAADSKYTPDGRRCEAILFTAAALAQAAFFCEDAVWEGGPFGGNLQGREAIFQSFLKAPWRHAMHFYQSPTIELDGDKASAQWLLWQIAVEEPSGAVMLLSGKTQESYCRDRDGWRITHMAFEKLHSICIASEASALVCRIPQVQKTILNTGTA